uniref:CW domain-containing protein n=1 Tax=Caenorhabditis tropicalis TaxID=1561998 RepID=A0A1I7T4Y8_9PELO
MMIVWGKPSSFNPVPQFYQNIDWPACIQTCYEYQSCVLAFQNTSGCNLFLFNGFPPIQKTNSTEGSIVAFKIYSTENRTDYVCPNGINAPTFNNKNATVLFVDENLKTELKFLRRNVFNSFVFQGYLYLDSNPDYYPEKVWYNISLTGSLWTLSYNWAPLCQFGYYGYYDNPDGTWCAMFLSSNLTKQNIGVNYDATACQRFGALFPTINYPVDAQVIPDSRFKGNLNNYGWATNAGARSGSDDDCLVLVYPPIGGNVKVDVRRCSDFN